MLGALHHVAPVLAAATDTTRRLAALLAEEGEDVDAAVLPDRGDLVPLPDRSPPPLLLG